MAERRWRGELRRDEPMAAHVSWRAGGRAACAFFPRDMDDLALFLKSLRHDEPLLFVGLGSNLLVRDGGFHGTVVFTHRALDKMQLQDDGLLYVEAGVASPKLARFAAKQGLAGAEFLAGIPGSFGGALTMNAGCYGDETWPHVHRLLTLDRHGERRQRGVEDFAVGYRHVGLRSACDEWFAAAWLRFARGAGDAARARVGALLEARSQSQPLNLPNAGSVFRNPPGDHAARLIEAAGLKGLQLGGARVSEKHANFIVNPDGTATATAIEMLIDHVRVSVREKFGVQLQQEVRIVGVQA